jgi:hypothetical protein
VLHGRHPGPSFSSMRNLFASIVVLASLIALSAQVQYSIQDCFVCPAQDLMGHLLLRFSESSSELSCRYQSTSNDLICKYFRVSLRVRYEILLSIIIILHFCKRTGLPKPEDGDDYCPLTAAIDCPVRKRRSVVPRSARPAGPGALATRSNAMKTRAELGAVKRRGLEKTPQIW